MFGGQCPPLHKLRVFAPPPSAPHNNLPHAMRRLALALALAAAALAAVDGRFIVEKGGVRINLPASARTKGPFAMSLANFGAPLYGGSLM